MRESAAGPGCGQAGHDGGADDEAPQLPPRVPPAAHVHGAHVPHTGGRGGDLGFGSWGCRGKYSRERFV